MGNLGNLCNVFKETIGSNKSLSDKMSLIAPEL